MFPTGKTSITQWTVAAVSHFVNHTETPMPRDEAAAKAIKHAQYMHIEFIEKYAEKQSANLTGRDAEFANTVGLEDVSTYFTTLSVKKNLFSLKNAQTRQAQIVKERQEALDVAKAALDQATQQISNAENSECEVYISEAKGPKHYSDTGLYRAACSDGMNWMSKWNVKTAEELWEIVSNPENSRSDGGNYNYMYAEWAAKNLNPTKFSLATRYSEIWSGLYNNAQSSRQLITDFFAHPEISNPFNGNAYRESGQSV